MCCDSSLVSLCHWDCSKGGGGGGGDTAYVSLRNKKNCFWVILNTLSYLELWKHNMVFISRVTSYSWIRESACIIIIGFLINVQVQGPYIHNSGPPSRQLACCMHGRSHTRSPGVSNMRVDSWEPPLSAIPLCQLFPSHLGPLKLKGCGLT